MTATTVVPIEARTTTPHLTGTNPTRPVHPTIPAARLVKLELRKMFNTRSGFWMLVSIAVLSILATGAVILFAPDSAVTYQSFATAIGSPLRRWTSMSWRGTWRTRRRSRRRARASTHCSTWPSG